MALGKYEAFKGVQTAASIYGTVESDNLARMSASANASSLENNAILADYEAAQAVELGILNIRRAKKELAQRQGSTRVAAAAGGVVVNEGSSLDILVSNAGEAARDESIMRWQSNMEAYRKTIEADNYRYQAAITRASAPSGFGTALKVLGQAGGLAASFAGGGE